MSTCSLKIKMIKIDGELRVPPDVMKLLLEMAGHRDVCDHCGQLWRTKQGNYCATGDALFKQLLEQPEVQLIPD